MALRKEDMERRLSSLIHVLPPEANHVDALLRAAAAKDPQRATIRAVVEKDSGLCSDLLFLANSSCYRHPGGRPVRTVEEALDRVDPSSLAALVGTSATAAEIHDRLGARKPWMEYTRHAREVAQATGALADVLDMSTDDKAMYLVAGLTHDIGRAVIMIAAEGEATSLLGITPDQMTTIVSDEQTAYGMDHCRIGYGLFQHWHFPDILQQGILRHHTPLLDKDLCRPGGIIFTAHFVAMSDFTGETIAAMLRQELLQELGLSRERLDAAKQVYRERTGPQEAGQSTSRT